MILQVSEDGLLDITQEMSKFGSDLGSPRPKNKDSDSQPYNPFNSPTRTSVNIDSHTHTMQSTAPLSNSLTSNSVVAANGTVYNSSLDNTAAIVAGMSNTASSVIPLPDGASRTLTFHPMVSCNVLMLVSRAVSSWGRGPQ